MIALFVIAVSAGRASAEFVIMEPPVVDHCPHGKTWPDVLACVTKLGAPTVLQSTAHERLVRVVQKIQGNVGDAVAATYYDLGVYLYVERGKQWQIAGMFEMPGDYELLSFDHVTIDGHRGYRFDIGRSMVLDVELDDTSRARSMLAQRIAVYCAGDSYRCTDITTACDVIVHGKTYWTFRGSIVVEPKQLRVVGDRRRSGAPGTSMCTQAAEVSLGWPQGETNLDPD
jgi:hypothetical protein